MIQRTRLQCADDLRAENLKWARDSRNERAATGHTATEYNQSKQTMAEGEHRNGVRSGTWRTHEGGTERHTHDEHTIAKLGGNEPHMAAHTTMTAHLAKHAEKHKRADEDGGRRQRTSAEKATKELRRHKTLIDQASAQA